MLRKLTIIAVPVVASFVYVSCKKETKKQGGGPTQSCPAGYVYSATPPPTNQYTQQNNQQNQQYNQQYNQQQNGYISPSPSPTYNGYNTGYNGSTYLQSGGVAVTWSQIQPIINSRCATSGCHDSRTRAKGYDLSTYQLTKSAGPGVVGSITGRRMPPGSPLTANEQSLFTQWQSGGFQEYLVNQNTNNGQVNNGQYGTTNNGYQTTTTYPGYNNGTYQPNNNTYGTGNASPVPANCYPR